MYHEPAVLCWKDWREGVWSKDNPVNQQARRPTNKNNTKFRNQHLVCQSWPIVSAITLPSLPLQVVGNCVSSGLVHCKKWPLQCQRDWSVDEARLKNSVWSLNVYDLWQQCQKNWERQRNQCRKHNYHTHRKCKRCPHCGCPALNCTKNTEWTHLSTKPLSFFKHPLTQIIWWYACCEICFATWPLKLWYTSIYQTIGNLWNHESIHIV